MRHLLCCITIAAAGCLRSDIKPVAQNSASVVPAAAAALPTPALEVANSQRGIPTPHQRLVSSIDSVMIVSIDGLRPDVLLRANVPRVRELCRQGSYTFWAETIPEAYTLPCHVSMLTGVGAEKHGVTWNEYLEESFSNVPTLFELAKKAGYSTALVAGKMKFIALAKPGTLDWQHLPPDEPVTDREVVAAAERIVRQHQPHVLFVHLPDVDTAGHDHGWGSAEQIAAVEEVDRLVGMLVDVLSDLALKDSTLVLLTSDHGGAGTSHGENDPRSRFIPWIVVGAGVRRDFDLTLKDERTIRTQDTFATACAFLGLDAGVDCEGNPVWEALAQTHDAAPAPAHQAQADAR